MATKYLRGLGAAGWGGGGVIHLDDFPSYSIAEVPFVTSCLRSYTPTIF